jgi:hypothetical protein
MICAHCDERIKPGQDYAKRDVETGSAAPTLYLYAWCRQAAEQLVARRTSTR